MVEVGWQAVPRWVKEAAVTLVDGRGSIERPIRFEDRNESIALWWADDSMVVEKHLVREYESEGGG